MLFVTEQYKEYNCYYYILLGGSFITSLLNIRNKHIKIKSQQTKLLITIYLSLHIKSKMKVINGKKYLYMDCIHMFFFLLFLDINKKTLFIFIYIYTASMYIFDYIITCLFELIFW